MFKSLGRSRSLKSQRPRGVSDSDQDALPARHGPESPILGQDRPGPVSDAPPTPTKQASPPNHITSGSPRSSHLPLSPPDNDGANAYVSRPLPEPPARSPARLAARQTTAERPSTSAGPGTGSSSTMSFDARSQSRPTTATKRMSKDDLYLSTYSTKSFRSYHIPIRGQLPSPHGSPRSRSPDPTIAVRTQTPDSLAPPNPGAPIGMALGSPSFAPPMEPPATSGSWQPQLRGMETRPPWEEMSEPSPVAKKPSKWRWLLGGKKNEAKDRQVMTPDLASTPMSDVRPKTASSMRHPEDVWRSNTTATKKAKKVTPVVVRANTEPAVEIPSASILKEPKTPKTPKTPKASKADLSRKASTKSLREGIKKSDISAPMPASAPPMPSSAPPMPPIPTLGRGGFLDVDIPDVKMERYSVMFNGILQPAPGGQQPARNPRNSVAIKRQATLRKLQSIQDAIIEEEARKGQPTPSQNYSPPRRQNTAPPATTEGTTPAADIDDTRTVTVTAPAPSSYQTHTKSPSFSLFPATPSASANKGRMNPPSRSTTSPAVLGSPRKSRFELMDPPGRPPIVPPPPVRSDTPESRTRSQMSQQSQDIPILLDGDDRGRIGFSASPPQQPRTEQRGYGYRGRSRSSSRSTQRSEQTLQGRELSQPRQNFDRVPKPAPLNISKSPRLEQQPRARSRSDSRSRIPQPIQTSQRHQQEQHHFRPDQSALVLDSPTDTTVSSMTQRTAPGEPTWQMMSPPSSSISSTSTSTSSRKRSPSSASSTYTQGSNYTASASAYTPATSHAPTASVDEQDRNPVEVSIARQISISRQQRNLLQQPGVRARPWMRADVTPAGVGSARVRKVGSDGERIGGTRMARPTYMRGGSPEVNRKSERIVLEGV